MTVDVASDHILIPILPTIHRKIIRSSLVFNMMKAVKFIFKLIFPLLGFAMSAPLTIARDLVVLLVHPYSNLPNAISLKRSELLIVAVTSHYLLLLSPTSSFVNVLLLLLLLMNVTADAYLLRDLWQFQKTQLALVLG